MQRKSQGTWAIALTFFLAYLLAIVPFPEWAMNLRPEWVAIVLVYWVIALPYKIGIGTAWFVGLLQDILEGSMLGLNAMALAIVAYITLSLHQRIRMFSSLQQSGLVFGLITLDLLITHWLQVVSAQTVGANFFFLLAAFTSAILWSPLFRLLRQVRRSFRVR